MSIAQGENSETPGVRTSLVLQKHFGVDGVSLFLPWYCLYQFYSITFTKDFAAKILNHPRKKNNLKVYQLTYSIY
jgi:hypothetical protein